MRSNHESGRFSGVELFAGNKIGVLIQTLGGTFTGDADMPHVWALDPAAADRTVLLPAEDNGLFYTIINTADAAGEELTIKDDANGYTVAIISYGERVQVFCANGVWYAFGDGRANAQAQGILQQGTIGAVVATAGAATYTIAQLKSGRIDRDPAGASRTDVFPTAALAVAGCPGVKVGDIIDCVINNVADAAETITLTAGAGGTLLTGTAAAVIAQNAQKTCRLRFTNVTSSSEAYDVTG